MAFDINNFFQVGPGGGGVRLFTYSSTDAQTVIRAANYFAGVDQDSGATGSAVDLLAVNDVILIASATGGTPVLSLSYCNAVDATAGTRTVDVTDGLTITATDSD